MTNAEGNNTPRAATIHDIKSSSVLKLEKVSPRELANHMRQEYDLPPEEKEEVYDSYVDKIVKTSGQRVSDEVFEQAKQIIYNRALELQIDGDNNIEVSDDNIEIEQDVIKESMNTQINKVPGPKRKK